VSNPTTNRTVQAKSTVLPACTYLAISLLTLPASLSALTPPDDFNPRASGGNVYALVVQADGKILVGGAFTNLCGEPRDRIARVNANGTLDATFNPGASALPGWGVQTLAVQTDGKIVVGGWFNGLGGQPRTGFGRVNPDGTVDAGFNPSVTYVSGSVGACALALQADGRILLGGAFTLVNGQPRTNLARLNPDGTLDAGFNPKMISGFVSSVAVQADGKILVGGGFSTLGGQSRNNIGRLNSDGTLDSSFIASTDPEPGFPYPYVRTILVQADSRIVLGGGFTLLNGEAHTRIGRLNANGTVDASFHASASSSPRSLALQTDGKIIVGGEFISLSGYVMDYIGRLNADGTLDPTFLLHPSGGAANYAVYALAIQTNGSVLVGGAFYTLGTEARLHLGRLSNNVTAVQNLTRGATAISWMRGGTAPEVEQVTFEMSTNSGSTWAPLGSGTRITGGWSKTGLGAPPPLGLIRARGRAIAGDHNGSSSLIEQVAGFGSGYDVGLRAHDGTAVIKLACEPDGQTTSPIRINKNGKNYGVLLVPTDSPDASKFRIQTSSGVKALRKLP
jgi:uncharacterized delta-60 repeat protein